MAAMKEWRGMSAVLLEHGASYDDIVPVKAVVRTSTTVGGRHRVRILRDAHFVTRIVCTRGDADAVTLCVGGGDVHIGLSTPFEAPIPLVALQYHDVCFNSSEPFEVRMTYGSLPPWCVLHFRDFDDKHMIVWTYANGNAFRACHGLGVLRQALDHGVASPRALRA